MNFEDRISELADRIPKIKDKLKTEEATKTSLVLPMLSILGYDYTNPLEVCPEYISDYGTKAGEKIDYAILNGDKILMLIECKSSDNDLTDKKCGSQLFRYFSTSSAKIGIATNGIRWNFYSDLQSNNKMDSKPFLEVDLEAHMPQQITVLRKFQKEEFNFDQLLPSAMDMMMKKDLVKAVNDEITNPSPELVELLTRRVYDGRITKKVMDDFTPLVSDAISQVFQDKFNEKLQSAWDKNNQNETVAPGDSKEEAKSGIITTEDEITGFQIVRAICASVVPIEKVFIRDAKSYCAILYDDNRKPICRLRFNTSQKQIGIFEDNTEKIIPISGISDISSSG
jgi:predicted type IV restriction endonuclease